MREKIFRHLLTKLEWYSPGLIKSIQIQILLNATAAAFERPGRMVWHLPEKKALAAYAEYTKACLPQRPDAANSTAGSAANSMAGSAVISRKRIYRCAYRLGLRIRRITGFSGREDRERLVFYLYSNIGIKMTGRLPGEIFIPFCYFADVYTPEQCRIMSLMDWGVIAGICGGGKLEFTGRITQGSGRCRAVFRAVRTDLDESDGSDVSVLSGGTRDERCSKKEDGRCCRHGRWRRHDGKGAAGKIPGDDPGKGRGIQALFPVGGKDGKTASLRPVL